MTSILQWTSFFLLFPLLLTIGSSCGSKEKDIPIRLVDDKLLPCPSSPNCVCSEFDGLSSSIPPIPVRSDYQKEWESAIATVKEMGGKVIQLQDRYLHATFTSRIFRFVDDFELHLDTENGAIHLRSASRTGYSDFGVNRKRAEKFRSLFAKKD